MRNQSVGSEFCRIHSESRYSAVRKSDGVLAVANLQAANAVNYENSLQVVRETATFLHHHSS